MTRAVTDGVGCKFVHDGDDVIETWQRHAELGGMGSHGIAQRIQRIMVERLIKDQTHPGARPDAFTGSLRFAAGRGVLR